jgi:hypothetical protein
MERVAECHCGELKAIVSGEPIQVYLCHCRACQHRTGSLASWGTRWGKDQVRLQGPQKIYRRRADSGFEVRCHFCPNCGTTVMAEGDRVPNLCVVAAGCFADLSFPAPTRSIWEETMHHWLEIRTISERHEQQGPPPQPKVSQ